MQGPGVARPLSFLTKNYTPRVDFAASWATGKHAFPDIKEL
jgi:hypothetical protein